MYSLRHCCLFRNFGYSCCLAAPLIGVAALLASALSSSLIIVSITGVLIVQETTSMDYGFLDHLTSLDEATFEHAWAHILAKFLVAAPFVREDQRQEVANAGARWQGIGFGQAQISRMLYTWSGVCVLINHWPTYRDIVVCTLALFYKLPNVPKTLQNEHAEAAFKLFDCLDGTPSSLQGDETPSIEPEAPTSFPLPWDVQLSPLLPYLLNVWSREKTRASMEGIEKRRHLKDVAFSNKIPREAQVNNHRADKDSRLNTLHRSWQHQMLQALRVAVVFDAALQGDCRSHEFAPEKLFLRLFALLGDLESKIREHRKGPSILNSVATSNPLFGRRRSHSHRR